MRKVLAFALLFVSATAVQAQEPAVQEAVESPTAIEAPAAPSASDAGPATAPETPPTVDLKTRSAAASAVDAATMRAPVDFDEAAQDVTAPRNFWWLVGAIVLAGVILALVL